MDFNLNLSRKPEVALQGNLIHENITMYGMKCFWLFSERANEDVTVFNDFSHYKVEDTHGFKTVFLKPEMTEMWDGDTAIGSFGIFQQQTANLFISKIDVIRLYPKFLTEKGARSKIVNSLVVTPGGSILEITHMEAFHEGVSNLFGYADDPNSYKITVKLYANNISDEGVQNIDDEMSLNEGPEGEIFSHTEEVDTTHIDSFFDDLMDAKETIDTEGEKTSKSGSIFGNLS